MVLVWRCQNGHEKERDKPGASVGSKAMMKCLDCGEQMLFVCIDNPSDGGGAPWDT